MSNNRTVDSSDADDTGEATWAALAERIGSPGIVHFAEIGSTLDVAHEMASCGAPAGTVVLADAQTAGRGRMGRSWRSEPGAGLWLTVIERPADASELDVLSLRIGLALAPVLDDFAPSPVRLKWPNDLYLGEKKLAGILVEARWRDGSPEWSAIGVGINLRAPVSEARAVGLKPDASRDALLERVVPAIHAAALLSGPLSEAERARFAERDLAAGRRCIEPARGVVRGIDANGGLVIDAADAGVVASGSTKTVVFRAGSLVLHGEGEGS